MFPKSVVGRKMEEDFKQVLSECFEKAKKREISKTTSFLEGAWSGISQATDDEFDRSPDTGVDQQSFRKLAEMVTELPEDMKFFGLNLANNCLMKNPPTIPINLNYPCFVMVYTSSTSSVSE